MNFNIFPKSLWDIFFVKYSANFELPVKGVLFDEVDFVELELDEAKPLVEKYRKEGVDKLGPNYRRNNRDRNRGGGQGNRDNRSRYDNRSPRGGYSNQYSGGYRGGYQSRGGRGGGYGGNYGGGYSSGGGYRDNRDRGMTSQAV